MQRYFCDIEDGNVILNKDDIHHISKVMRQRNGENLIAVCDGKVYLCEIDDVTSGKVHVIEEIEQNVELDVDVTLIYSMPKGDKFEFVLQKATELGVKRIVPLISKRSVVKLDEKSFSKKKVRYTKILKEAAEQSYRNYIPVIEDYITLKDVEKYLGDINLVAYEESAKNGEMKMFKECLKQAKVNDHIVIIVGCEGGFEQSEIDFLEGLGVKACSLGKRILRSETAPLYMLSCISYELELK